jgi:endonuclease YncB( thermonuclease family)
MTLTIAARFVLALSAVLAGTLAAAIPASAQGNVRDVRWREARPTRWIDGDTVDVEINMGFGSRSLLNMRVDLTIRVLHINAPELTSRDPAVREQAIRARAFAEAWIVDRCGLDQETRWPIHVWIADDSTFDRSLGEIACANSDLRLHQDLLDAGLAVPYED